jgi:hypothetical protein
VELVLYSFLSIDINNPKLNLNKKRELIYHFMSFGTGISLKRRREQSSF